MVKPKVTSKYFLTDLGNLSKYTNEALVEYWNECKQVVVNMQALDKELTRRYKKHAVKHQDNRANRGHPLPTKSVMQKLKKSIRILRDG